MRALAFLAVACALVGIAHAQFDGASRVFFPDLAQELQAPVPGENKFTVNRPEGTRTFYAWVPKGYFNSTRPYAVIIAWHGLNNECTHFGPEKGFQKYADAHNFIYVYPCGTKGLAGIGWNAGTCCLRWSGIDDIGFAGALVSTMQANFRVNNSRIFSTGHSNGAMMTETLTCTTSMFAAVASVAGTTVMEPGNAGGLTSCSGEYAKHNNRPHVLLIHGDADWVVPWTGSKDLGFPSIPDNAAAWKQRNGCSGQPVVTIDKKAWKNELYRSCKAPNGKVTQFEVVRNIGGSHAWPHDNDFDSTQYVVEFFKRTVGL